MCNLGEYIKKQAYEEGVAEGEHRAETLFRKRLEDDRMADVKRAAEDPDYRKMLMKEFLIDQRNNYNADIKYFCKC